TQNISYNLNTTYRNPTLLERYACGAVLGGGPDLQVEEGSHTEIS
ncbi:MAG: hypothetical protein ACJAY2_003477, partial [Pseudomonadales bacterium]